MRLIRNPIPIVLALTLVFANVVCACAMEGDGSGTGEHHAQHQHQEDSAPAGTDCDNQDCLDCVASTVAKLPERVASLGAPAKVDVEDPTWVAIAEEYSYSVFPRAGSSPPPPESRLLALSSPVQRADLLLE